MGLWRKSYRVVLLKNLNQLKMRKKSTNLNPSLKIQSHHKQTHSHIQTHHLTMRIHQQIERMQMRCLSKYILSFAFACNKFNSIPFATAKCIEIIRRAIRSTIANCNEKFTEWRTVCVHWSEFEKTHRFQSFEWTKTFDESNSSSIGGKFFKKLNSFSSEKNKLKFCSASAISSRRYLCECHNNE